ncbi:TPA: hypothetical protein DCZ32_01610 [Candidatus Uhrbacteria bacterium]|nr:hypothetical protein [Candidatus Uhrbacteria bacterium]
MCYLFFRKYSVVLDLVVSKIHLLNPIYSSDIQIEPRYKTGKFFNKPQTIEALFETAKTPKDMTRALNNIERQFSKTLKDYYSVVSLRIKLAKLERFAKLAFRKSGGALPKNWSV